MPPGVYNQEWLHQNGQRHYPLADDASGVADTGFVLPEDFLLELDLAVHAGLDVSPGRFFLMHLGAYSSGYMVVVGYQPVTGNAVKVATATIARQNHTRNKLYALGGVGDFSDVQGKLVIGRLDAIDGQPPGFHTLTLDSGRLDPDAVRPIIRGISSLVVVNNGQRSAPLYGDIELVAGSNALLVPSAPAGQASSITFNALRGEGTVDDCECTGSDALAPPIRTINGVPPTPGGDFYLVASKCIDIAPTGNGLLLTDTCSTPCCGCVELEAITRDLERLKREARSVEDFAGRLAQSVETMSQTVLGARLGDRGCEP